MPQIRSLYKPEVRFNMWSWIWQYWIPLIFPHHNGTTLSDSPLCLSQLLASLMGRQDMAVHAGIGELLGPRLML